MSFLAAPGWVASVAVLLAVAMHPATGLERWSGARAVVPALALLFALSLAACTFKGRLSDRVAALGALIALAALGYDALRGSTGTLTLATGQATSSFEEEGPGGRRLGVKPLGFTARLERVEPSGELALGVGAGDTVETQIRLGPDRAAGFGGLRFGDPQVRSTGGANALRLAVSGPSGAQEVEIVPGQVARVADAELTLEQYFADFALDDKRQPFSRSSEARNPAALLDVKRGERVFRVFVIQALPGIHWQAGLELAFALVGVDPERAARLRVSETRAAPLAAGGIAIVVLGLALALREAA